MQVFTNMVTEQLLELLANKSRAHTRMMNDRLTTRVELIEMKNNIKEIQKELFARHPW